MNSALKKLSMNPLRIVRLSTLQETNDKVLAELDALGFYDEHLAEIQVYLVPAGAAYGYQLYGGDRSICIPMVSASHLLDMFLGRKHTVRDVLLHEYGHALADTHRGLMHSRRFSSVFGGSHSSEDPLEYDREAHVTTYAATNPSEDFAELFWLYVKHKGRIPHAHQKPAIRRKWKFIKELSQAIRAGQRRWS